MITWIKNLFEPKRKKRTYLGLERVNLVRADIGQGFDKEAICLYYDISESTYYSIRNGTHHILRKD